ncbi:MAG: THUMP domain-containing protein [Nitrososphaerota archaeon]|nr:THUMP domain-containing protein [Candidatus Calditenuaceae archaeon]MDW8073346.1 THUMP domain-containing protein [Nitrososphaerota archaeon]
MKRLLALLSGDAPALALSELKSILHILYSRDSVEVFTDRLVLIESKADDAGTIVERGAYVKEIIEPVIYAPVTEAYGDVVVFDSEILNAARSFAVRAVRLGDVGYNRAEVERWLGGVVESRFPHLEVNLSSPEVVVQAYITGKGFAAGPLLSRQRYDRLEARRPKMRPFRHPSALMPRLARCMVNLTRVKPGGWIVDPFAGTGSIPMEAADMGYRVIAVELKRWIARGCLLNLKWSGHADRVELICGDAANPPLRGTFQGVATDPPYGRSTQLSDRNIRRLYLNAFSSITQLLEPGSRVVAAIPQQRIDPALLEEAGLQLLEQHPIRIHSGLTRIVCIYEARP